MAASVQKDSDGILCDMCPEEDRKPARKTCMKCEISMCVQHLQAHLTTPVLLQTHPLTEPMALDGNTKCPQHGKLLEYYCLDDMTCVCVSCAIEDQHRLHNMKTFSTAHKELMEKLKAEQQALQEKTQGDNTSLEKWEKSEREKLGRCSVRLIEAVTNLRDVCLTSVQSSVSARMVSIKTSRSSMQAAQKEKDTFRFLQMFSQVNQDVEKAKVVDLRKGLEPGSHRDKLVQEIIQKGEKIMTQASKFTGSLLNLVDPENQQELTATPSDLVFVTQSSGPEISLSKDGRKVFHNIWLGRCFTTLLIRSTKSTPNYQRWIISLNKESDWMIGLCDKQSANDPKVGPVYGLCCEDNHLSCFTTEYDEDDSSGGLMRQKLATDTSKKFEVHSELLKYQAEDKEMEQPRPETVEVVWNFASSQLSFFSRTGRYKREEIMMIETSVNNWDLVPFVWLKKENVLNNDPQQQWTCSCGRSNTCNQMNCSWCGKISCQNIITEMVCELL